MSLDNLKKLDVTLSMSGTTEAILAEIGKVGDGKSAADKEALAVIYKKLVEVDEAFDRPLDSPETFVKLKDIAQNAGNADLQKYCQAQVNMTVTVSGPQPVASSISLSASTSTVKNKTKVSLSWSGSSASRIDIYRNNSRMTTVSNSGSWTDSRPS